MVPLFVLTEVWCKLGFAVKGLGSLGQLVSQTMDVYDPQPLRLDCALQV